MTRAYSNRSATSPQDEELARVSRDCTQYLRRHRVGHDVCYQIGEPVAMGQFILINTFDSPLQSDIHIPIEDLKNTHLKSEILTSGVRI